MEFLFSCSTRHLAIELNARREIPYLRAPMYYSLYLIIIKFGYNARCHWLKERAL